MRITVTIEVDHPEELQRAMAAMAAMARGGEQVNIIATKVDVKGADSDRVVQQAVQQHEQKAAAVEKGSQEAKDRMAAARAAKVAKVAAEAAAEPEVKKDEPVKNGVNNTKKASAGVTSTIELPDNIKNAGNMKELLVYLYEHGASDERKMIDLCMSLRESVPHLAKASKMYPTDEAFEARIKKSVDLLGFYAQPQEPTAE